MGKFEVRPDTGQIDPEEEMERVRKIVSIPGLFDGITLRDLANDASHEELVRRIKLHSPPYTGDEKPEFYEPKPPSEQQQKYWDNRPA